MRVLSVSYIFFCVLTMLSIRLHALDDMSLTEFIPNLRPCSTTSLEDCFNNPEDWRNPYFISQENQLVKKEVVILVHGFTDSPYTFRHFLPLFLEKEVSVVSIRLKGHSDFTAKTNYEAIIATKKEEWQKQLQDVINQFYKDNYEINLVGYSLGGLLSVDAALTNKNIIKRMILFAPALSIRSPIPILYSGSSCVLPSMVLPKRFAIGDVNTYIADEKISSKASCQLSQLAFKTKRRIDRLYKNELDIPTFVVFANDDAQVRNNHTRKWLELGFNNLQTWVAGNKENRITHTGLMYPVDAKQSQNADRNLFFNEMLTDLSYWWDSTP